MKQIVLASANKKKIEELKALLPDILVQSLHDVGFDKNIEEPFFTFEENAFQKANTIYQFCGKNVLADDSGICVPALQNEPGVLSARYAGVNATDQENLDKLIVEMQFHTNKSAFYKAILCLIWNGTVHYFEGECYGTLVSKAAGSNGFGYDPVFIPDGYQQTFAELPPTVKHQISHRAKAMKKLIAFLENQ